MEEILKQMLLKQAVKFDFLLIGKTIIEFILFIILLRVINKAFNVFFEKAQR